MSQVAVIAKIPAAPGQRDQLIAALQAALQTAQSEEGTLQYILHEDSKDPDLVWFYELYRDQDALTAHGSSDGMKAMGPSIAPFVGGRPEMTFLKPVAGKGL
jgi:quinol monooxygenase YgiN